MDRCVFICPRSKATFHLKIAFLRAVEDREGERSRVNPVEKAKRYLVFLIGLFINSLGVSLSTKAELGTSPISSIPYVLSLNFPSPWGSLPYCSACC